MAANRDGEAEAPAVSGGACGKSAYAAARTVSDGLKGRGCVNWDKIEQAVRKAIDDRGARDPAQRARIYGAARAALGRRPDVDADALARFDALAGRIEAGYAPKPAETQGRSRLRGTWNAARPWLLFAAGVLVGAGALLFADAIAVNSAVADKEDMFRRNYEATRAQVPVASEFLHEVADAVIKAQGGDRKRLDATKKFVALAKFDPDLAKNIPRTLPKGSAVILKADPFNFKILFNWPLCGTVSISNPDMVDPVRALPNAIGCPYFGLWTSGASRW